MNAAKVTDPSAIVWDSGACWAARSAGFIVKIETGNTAQTNIDITASNTTICCAIAFQALWGSGCFAKVVE